MMLLTEAADRAVEDGDVKALTKLLEENPTIPIVPLLSRAIRLVAIGFSTGDARLSVVEELIKHSFVATDDLLKAATSLEEEVLFPSESSIEVILSRQAKIEILIDHTSKLSSLIDDSCQAKADKLKRITKIVGIIHSNLEAQKQERKSLYRALQLDARFTPVVQEALNSFAASQPAFRDEDARELLFEDAFLESPEGQMLSQFAQMVKEIEAYIQYASKKSSAGSREKLAIVLELRQVLKGKSTKDEEVPRPLEACIPFQEEYEKEGGREANPSRGVTESLVARVENMGSGVIPPAREATASTAAVYRQAAGDSTGASAPTAQSPSMCPEMQYRIAKCLKIVQERKAALEKHRNSTWDKFFSWLHGLFSKSYRAERKQNNAQFGHLFKPAASEELTKKLHDHGESILETANPKGMRL